MNKNISDYVNKSTNTTYLFIQIRHADTTTILTISLTMQYNAIHGTICVDIAYTLIL